MVEKSILRPRLEASESAAPTTNESQTFGDRWIERQESMVLRIPSVVIRPEFNYLINPSHPDFTRIEVGDPIAFPVDPRSVNQMLPPRRRLCMSAFAWKFSHRAPANLTS
jgi:RES domain-containing protein